MVSMAGVSHSVKQSMAVWPTAQFAAENLPGQGIEVANL